MKHIREITVQIDSHRSVQVLDRSPPYLEHAHESNHRSESVSA